MAVCLGRCNCDTLSPKRSSNVAVMNKGSAYEAVVVVKGEAYEDMVTYWRIKLHQSEKEIGDEGRNIIAVIEVHY